MRKSIAVLGCLGLLAGWALAGPESDAPDPNEILPPVPAWNGKSLSLVVPADHEWATPFEKRGLKTTPRYRETVAWLRRLADRSEHVQMVSLGKSDEGRTIWLVIASADKAFTPDALRATGKPVLFAQAAIHSGEVDGKDAGMMLLRDMTVRGTRAALLEKAAFLFIPILSVDGHERFGPFSRVNQRGPVQMGWRTNSRNLNLNRDYSKIDTAGVRAAVAVLNEWRPDLYYDLHVTDGADYQYDITWGFNGGHAWSPASSTWLKANLDPALTGALKQNGHVPGPLVFAVDAADMNKGNAAPTFGPRYSHGYGDLRHTPAVLVENHSLKPFRQRVLGTYVLLASTLKLLGESGLELRAAADKDRARRPDPVPLSWKKRTDGDAPEVTFLGIEQKLIDAPVIGGKQVVWTGKPVTLRIPLIVSDVVALEVRRPKAYWIPPAWHRVISRLNLHGIKMERIHKARTVRVRLSRVIEPELAKTPFEGRVRVKAKFRDVWRTQVYPADSVRISTDQPLGDLAVALLEPSAPDSLFQWGFFLEVLQRTEYVENYAMVPLARLMLKNKKLKARYDEKLKDEAFRKDPRARLRWLYEQSPYFDRRWRIYPVGREEEN